MPPRATSTPSASESGTNTSVVTEWDLLLISMTECSARRPIPLRTTPGLWLLFILDRPWIPACLCFCL